MQEVKGLESGKIIFIGALPYNTEAKTLEPLLAPFGLLSPVEVHADWNQPKHEPYALAKVKNYEEAILQLDGHKIGAHYLRVHLWRTHG